MNTKPIGKHEFDNIIFNVYEVDSIKQNSDDWYKLRRDYIGSSEIATILDLSKFSSMKELIIKKVFPEKIDEKKSNRMIMGSILEPVIGDFILPYFERDIETTLSNYMNNTKIRNVVKDSNTYLLEINNIFKDKPYYIIVSPDYVDVDYKIPYDIKTMTKYSYDSFISNTNPNDYILQSLMQQIVFNSEIGYLFIMIDANDIKLFEINMNEYVPMFETLYDSLEKFHKDCEFAKTLTYDEFITKYIDVKFDTSNLSEPENDVLEINRNNIDEILNEVKLIQNDLIDHLNIETLIELCLKYININEDKKELARLEDSIKSIFKQIGNGYKYIIIDTQEQGFKVKINLAKFKIQEK